ncbi:hypothetical protein ACLB2K_066185 [Fragaria x ananassa]
MATYRALLSLKSSLDDPDSRLSALRLLNVFNRTFPPELSNLTNLRVLDLYNNNLTGVLPVSLVDPRLRTRTTGVAGTFGYMAPEYAFYGRASKESDMFSFGVVASEIACKRQTYQDGEYHMGSAVLPSRTCSQCRRREIGMDIKYDPSEMECLLIVGLWCTHLNSKERPKAGQVMKVLLHEAPLPQLQHDRQTHYHSQYA